MKGINSRAAVLDRTAERIKPEWIDRGKSAPKHSNYIGNPIAFIESELGDKLTIEQKAILTRIKDGGEINVQAAHGVGKSFIASRIVFYQTVVLERETITTAPTFRQVKNVLWKEVRKLNSKVKQKFTGIEAGQVFLRSGDGSAFGFTAQHNSTDAFQGNHAPGIGVIIDEACGVSNEIDEGAIACAVDSDAIIIRIGNPTDPRTAFAKACKSPGTIKIPVWNHPNVSWAYDGQRLHDWIAIAIGLKDGRCNKRSEWLGQLKNLKDPVPGAIAIEWIEKVRYKFSEDSAYWQGRVCAEFPDNAHDGVIPHSWLVAARARYDRDPDYWDNLAGSYYWNLGVDVADGGGDRHAIASWGGRVVLYSIESFIPKGNLEDVLTLADITGRKIRSLGTAQVAVDNTGVGSGTLGGLRRAGYLASPCMFGAGATDTPEDGTKYKNLKTQLFWELRESLQRGEVAIAPLGELEDQLFEELAAHQYEIDAKDVTYLLPKAIVKKKLGRSPDLADAAVIGRSLGLIHKHVELPKDAQWWEMGVEDRLSELADLSQKLGL
jgi:hypothetical protein